MLSILKKALKNSAVYGIGTLSTKMIGFILLPLYTGYFTVEDYGILAIIEISYLIFVALVSLKIDSAFFRWFWDKEYVSKQKSIFFSSIILLLVTGSIFFISIYLLSEQISILLFSVNSYSYLLKLMAFSVILQVLIELIYYLMRAQEKSIFFSVTTIVRLSFSLLLTILFIVKYDRGISGIYEAQIISQILFLIIVLKYVFRNIVFKIELQIIIGMLLFSSPLILAEISGIMLSIADRLCLNFLDTTANVGIYSLSFKVSNSIRMFIYVSAMMAISPMIYQYIDKPNNKRFYSKLLTYFAFIIMFCVIILSFFAKETIVLFAQNEDYWSAWKLIPILSIGILFGILKDISLTGLNITKNTKIIAYVIFIMAIINIGLNFLLIPLLSVFGSAIASLSTKIVSFYIFYKFAQKYFFIPYEIKKILITLFWGISLILISIFITTSNINFYLSALLKLIMLPLFPILLYYSNFFEEIEILRIKQSWNKWKNPKNWSKNISQIKFK